MDLFHVWCILFLCMVVMFEVSGYSTFNSPKKNPRFVFPYGGRYNKVHHPAAYEASQISYNHDNYGHYVPIRFPNEFTEPHHYMPKPPRYKEKVPVFHHIESPHGYNSVGLAFPHHIPPRIMSAYPTFVDYSYQGLGYGYPGYGK